MSARKVRCPNCQTVFRVNPEQLRTHGGNVRCGQCYTAFNARAYLLAADNERLNSVFVLEDAQTAPRATPLPLQPSADVAPAATSFERPPVVHAKPPAPVTPRPAAAPVPRPAPAPVQAAERAERRPDVPESEQDVQDRYRPAGRPSTFASTTPRWLQGLGIGLLLGLLAVQSLYLWRNTLARDLPGLRPTLVSLCAQLGCTISLPRDSERITIESSDLQADPRNPAHHVLHAQVRNAAPYAQQPPHIELTLTDASDRAVVRRVLSPEEWLGGNDALLTDGLAPDGYTPLRLDFTTRGTGLATGYRMYAFYP